MEDKAAENGAIKLYHLMAKLLGILVSMQRHYILFEQAAAIKIRELS